MKANGRSASNTERQRKLGKIIGSLRREFDKLTDIELSYLESGSRSLSREVGTLVKEFTHHARLIDVASEFMRRHCHLSSLRESTVAAEVGIGADFLSMLFPRFAGKKYIDQLTHFRVERAKRLLRGKRSVPMTKVAFECGYKHLQSLKAAMARVGAETPRSYRSRP